MTYPVPNIRQFFSESSTPRDPNKPSLVLEISRLPLGTHYFRLIPPFSVGYLCWGGTPEGGTLCVRSEHYREADIPVVSSYDPEKIEKPTKALASFAWSYGQTDADPARLVFLVFNKYSAAKQMSELELPDKDDNGNMVVDRRDIIINITEGVGRYSILADTRSKPSDLPEGAVECLTEMASRGRFLDPSGYWKPHGKVIKTGTPSGGAAQMSLPTAGGGALATSDPAPVPDKGADFKQKLRDLAGIAGIGNTALVQAASPHLGEDGTLTRDGFAKAANAVAVSGIYLTAGTSDLGTDATETARIGRGSEILSGVEDKARYLDWTKPDSYARLVSSVFDAPDDDDEIPF